MILPLRVLGSSAVKRISSGREMAPIFCADVLLQLRRPARARSACLP